jgi:hypothetical protein
MKTIFELKEHEVTETPLLLFECELSSGVTERWSTHRVEVDGNVYQPAILKHNAYDIRASADEGIDALAKISVTLANADSHFSEIDRTVGFKGSKLLVKFLFFDLKNNIAATAASAIFRGVANPPDEITESNLRLTFNNRLSMQRLLLPEVRIQKRCPWIFPANDAQRTEGVHGGTNGKCSPFFRCGYSPGLTDGAGSLNNGVAFTQCDYTRTSCEQRGMFDLDASGKITRRFGGIEFVPSSIVVRSYGESGSHLVSPVENEAKYNDFVPLIYGTAWYQPGVIFARNDGNLTHMEVLLGMGEIEGVLKVLVNGIEIPAGIIGANMTSTGWFNIVCHGNRTGNFNADFTDVAGHPLGDPYGSLAVIDVVVPNRINDGKSLPTIKVLAQGMKLSTFDSEGGYVGEMFSNNPAWVLFDVLSRSGWAREELDIPSFFRVAEYCDTQIQTIDLNGNAISTPRFQCNLVVRKRRSAADLLRGIRNGSGLALTFSQAGQLQLRAETSLELQQPQKLDGSNSTEQLNGGWPAYEFGDGNLGFSAIARKNNGAPSVRMYSKSTADSPNRLSVEFQDAFNEYQQDSVSLVELDDVLQVGQEISAPLTALGIPNLDQAIRVVQFNLAKSSKGNSYIEFDTSVKAFGLRVGDLITVTYLKEGLQRSLFRIIRLAPGMNFRLVTITAQKHDDAWYEGSSATIGGYTGRQPAFEIGLPRPLTGTTIDANGATQFGVEENQNIGTDGSVDISLRISFTQPRKPVTAKTGIPLVGLSPTTTSAGGALAGNQSYYYVLTSVDSDGRESGLSFTVRATIPAGTNTNQVTLTNLSFAPGTAGFNVYRGRNPQQLTLVASAVPAATTFTDSGLTEGVVGPPDENYDHANFYWRFELQSELTADIATANTVGNSSLQMMTHEYRGMTVRITQGKGAGQERAVLANDPTTLAISPAWTIIPDTTSKFAISDSTWQFGATSQNSPIEFSVPNREGVSIEISGRSANVNDKECFYELSPLTVWRIGGGVGNSVDENLPPAPSFGLFAVGRGEVDLLSVSFPSFTNTRTVTAGTLTLHCWNEFNSPTAYWLSTSIDESADEVGLNIAGGAATGDLIQVDAEVMAVVEHKNGGMNYTVTRGAMGTTPAAHILQPAGQIPIYHLERRVSIVPFPRDFFGTPASGSYAHTVSLAHCRIAAAELFVTNTRGNSPVAHHNYTSTEDFGIRTLNGGQITIQVEGYLAIQDEAAPAFVLDDYYSVRDIFAVVGAAPTGAAIIMQVRQDDEVFCTLTIPSTPAGTTISNVVDGFGLAPLQHGKRLLLDILSVGTSGSTTPGSDLTVTIRL